MTRLERLRAPGTDEFWTRRVTSRIAGIELAVLSPPDLLAYAALARAQARPARQREARFTFTRSRGCSRRAPMTRRSGASGARCIPRALRRLEAVVFRLADEWFGCPAVAAGDLLPAAAEAWFECIRALPRHAGVSPQQGPPVAAYQPARIARADAWRVARRRLLPGNLPPRSGTGRAGIWPGYFAYTARRLRHHADRAAADGTLRPAFLVAREQPRTAVLAVSRFGRALQFPVIHLFPALQSLPARPRLPRGLRGHGKQRLAPRKHAGNNSRRLHCAPSRAPEVADRGGRSDLPRRPR